MRTSRIFLVAAVGMLGCKTDTSGTPYTPGPGLSANGTTLSVDQAQIESWAKDACYDSPAEISEAAVSALAAQYQPRAKRIVVVSPVAGDDLASGAALRQAVTTCGATETDHVVIFIEPGGYDLGSSGLVLPNGVALVGLDQGYTQIVSSSPVATIAATNPDPANHGFWLALHGINIANQGGVATSTSLLLDDVSAEIRDVTFNAFDGTAATYGIWARKAYLHTISDIRLYASSANGTVAGIFCDACTATPSVSKIRMRISDGGDLAAVRVDNGGNILIRDLWATVIPSTTTPALSQGLYVVNGSAELADAYIVASGSALGLGPSARARIKGSELNADTPAAITLGASASATITSSMINGAVTGDPTATVTIANTEVTGIISGPAATCFAVSRGWQNVAGLNVCP